MNFLDYVVIAVLVVCVFMGMKTGLIKTAVTALGVYAGWLLAGQYSATIADSIADSIESETVVTVISYAVIIGLAVVISGVVTKVVRPFLAVATAGLSSMADRVGGMVMGLAIGIAISGSLFLGMARLTYSFDLLSISGKVPSEVSGALPRFGDHLARLEDKKMRLEKALSGSALVSVFISVTDSLPLDALGYVPTDFEVSLGLLKSEMRKSDTQSGVGRE